MPVFPTHGRHSWVIRINLKFVGGLISYVNESVLNERFNEIVSYQFEK